MLDCMVSVLSLSSKSLIITERLPGATAAGWQLLEKLQPSLGMREGQRRLRMLILH